MFGGLIGLMMSIPHISNDHKKDIG